MQLVASFPFLLFYSLPSHLVIIIILLLLFIYIFICSLVLYLMTLVVDQNIFPSNDPMIHKHWIEQVVRGSDRCLNWGTIPVLPWKDWGGPRKISVRTFCISAGIRTGYLPDTSQQCCRLKELARIRCLEPYNYVFTAWVTQETP
jgi:hypothetical protein